MIELQDKELNKIADYLKNNFGINLEKKKKLIEGRLGNRIADMGFESYSDYFDHVFSDVSGSEMTLLINKLTTNHTFFMREENHFLHLKNEVLPYLERNVKDNDIRIWSAGSSSGEEAYTAAMVIQEYFGASKKLWDTRILATDISEKCIMAAQKGIYSSDAVGSLPTEMKNKYFSAQKDGSWQINSMIRDEVFFRYFNLIKGTFPFKRKFHLIFCRNVMIYFDNKTKMELVRKFYEHSEKGAYLYIGHSESLNREECGYTFVRPAIYRKL